MLLAIFLPKFALLQLGSPLVGQERELREQELLLGEMALAVEFQVLEAQYAHLLLLAEALMELRPQHLHYIGWLARLLC